MTKNTKTILGVVVVAGVIYYAYQKNWLKNPFKSFTADENTFHDNAFNNFTADEKTFIADAMNR
jgi:hypothetical protein